MSDKRVRSTEDVLETIISSVTEDDEVLDLPDHATVASLLHPRSSEAPRHFDEDERVLAVIEEVDLEAENEADDDREEVTNEGDFEARSSRGALVVDGEEEEIVEELGDEEEEEEDEEEGEEDESERSVFSGTDSVKSILGPAGRGNISDESTTPFDIEPKIAIDREYLCDAYRQLVLDRADLEQKSAILQSVLEENFQNHHIDTENEEDTPENEAKYIRKLKVYDEVRTLEENERLSGTQEMDKLINDKILLEESVTNEFESLLEIEREAGKKLKDPKIPKLIHHSVIERNLRIQKAKIEELNRCRAKNITMQYKIKDIDKEIDVFENVGEGLRMIDYEEFRVKSQNLQDKIEETEDEILKLRQDSQEAGRLVAHLKQKSQSIYLDIEKKSDELRDQDLDHNCARSQMNLLSQKLTKVRDGHKRQTTRAGLLMQPHLLREFEASKILAESMADELEMLMRTCADQQDQLLKIQSSITLLEKKEVKRSIQREKEDLH